jgi:hypothetical protein
MSTGKAQLEGEVLVFRGDFRLEIPFEAMKDVHPDGDALVIKTADQEARFELGAPVADRWARLIKEPKGLFEKLEVGSDSRVAVVDINDSLFVQALRERTAHVAEGRVPEGAPIVFLGAETRDALRKIPLLRARMDDKGAIWVVRPKGSKAISEGDVFEAAKIAGLVDTKVVSFSKTHTAHKCVIPVELRGKPAPPRPPILSIPPSSPLIPQGRGKGAAKAAASKPKPKPAAKAMPAKKPAAPAKAKPAARLAKAAKPAKKPAKKPAGKK